MSLVLQITSGSRAGQRAEFSKSVVIAGRHPDSDLRFDVQKDLDVSTRHAEFRGNAGGWTVHDLGSTNGTFVNGTRITAPQTIRAGDSVTFGGNGPRVDVVAAGDVVADGSAPRTEFRPSVGAAGRPKTEERIAIAVAKQTGSLKKFVIALGVFVVVGIGTLAWLNQRSTANANAVIEKLVARSDSLAAELQRTLADNGARVSGFDSVVRILRQDRDRLARARQSGGNTEQITSELTALQRRESQAVMLTSRENSDSNGKAVGYVIVEDQAKRPFSGTAFSITPDGLMVTNGHVLLDDEGRPPSRVGVYFADTDKFLPARFISATKDPDIGFFQIEVPGTYPTVRGVASNDGIGVGDHVLVIGFPLGTDLAQQGNTKKATLTAGLVSKLLLPNAIDINAFSAQGSSGSPVFDARGYVIGVLNSGYGATSSSLSGVVPSNLLIARLPANAKSIVKR